MNIPSQKNTQTPRSHRPRASAVFIAAFVAGAVAAVGVNRALDVHIAQSKPKVESEPIFVALRGLPQGSPVTVWDVALRDWPKAMLPAAAMRPQDSFEGLILKYPLREGQPLLAVQLAKAPNDDASQLAVDSAPTSAPAAAIPATVPPATAEPQPDLWAPAEQPTAVQPAAKDSVPAVAVVSEPVVTEQPAEPATAEAPVAPPIVAPVTVAAAPLATDVEPAVPPVAPVQTAPRLAARYLVVPERIALQADRSFVPPAATAPKIQEAVHPIVQQPVEVQQTPVRQGSKAASKRQPQRSATNVGRPDVPAPREGSTSTGSLFPKLSGSGNVAGGRADVTKQDREARDPATVKPGASQSPQPTPRSAWLPFLR